MVLDGQLDFFNFIDIFYIIISAAGYIWAAVGFTVTLIFLFRYYKRNGIFDRQLVKICVFFLFATAGIAVIRLLA